MADKTAPQVRRFCYFWILILVGAKSQTAAAETKDGPMTTFHGKHTILFGWPGRATNPVFEKDLGAWEKPYLDYFRVVSLWYPKILYGALNLLMFRELRIKETKSLVKPDEHTAEVVKAMFKDVILKDPQFGDQNWAMNLFTDADSTDPAVVCTRREEGQKWGQSYPASS